MFGWPIARAHSRVAHGRSSSPIKEIDNREHKLANLYPDIYTYAHTDRERRLTWGMPQRSERVIRTIKKGKTRWEKERMDGSVKELSSLFRWKEKKRGKKGKVEGGSTGSECGTLDYVCVCERDDICIYVYAGMNVHWYIHTNMHIYIYICM